VCSWKEEAEGSCKLDLGDELRVGVITYHGSHDSKVKLVKDTWLKNYLLESNQISIISDLESKEKHIVNSQCREGVAGLCCKTIFLYKHLYENAPHVKWFMRVMDDTYVHLPNVLEHISHYDENVPLLLGVRQVISPKINDWQRFEDTQGPEYADIEEMYPQGGAGWILSRAYIQKMLEPENLKQLSLHFEKHNNLDDLGFGDYTYNYMKVPVTHNKGFAHITWELAGCPDPNQICPDEPRATFNTTFYSLHSRTKWQQMPDVHKIFVHGSFTGEYIPSAVHNDRALWRLCKCKEKD